MPIGRSVSFCTPELYDLGVETNSSASVEKSDCSRHSNKMETLPLSPVYCKSEWKSNKRGGEITPLFLEEEGWARNDWETARKSLSADEVARLDPDSVIRTVRSSGFIVLPERRKKRNLSILRSRIRWSYKYEVNKISDLAEGKLVGFKRLKRCISPTRVEQFRKLILPLKIYGSSKVQHPIVKFSLQESRWKEASKLFKDSLELKYLLILSLEGIMSKIREMNCKSYCNDGSVSVTGKYVLICDVEGLNLNELKHGYRLQMYKIAQLIWKYYPDTVLKTYVINSKHCKHASHLLYPFVSKQIISRMKFFSNEKSLFKNLTETDGLSRTEIPLEYGGTLEGSYVLDVLSD